jgi:hypothetical protein
MRRIILSSVACLALPYTGISETFLTLRIIQRDTIINVETSSCIVSVILVRFYCILNFLDRFSKNTQIPNFMKIRPVGDELFHADGRTETDGQRQTDRDRQTDRQKA